MTTPIELFTIPEAAQILRVPEGWLRKKVTARVVVCTRLGKHVRFTRDQLLELIAAGESPIEATASRTNGVSPRARRLPVSTVVSAS